MTTSSSKTSAASNTALDVNALLNRTSVALARSQRLIDSWLPAADKREPYDHTANDHSSSNPSSGEAGTNDKAAMQDLLAQVGRSEKAGLGYVDPALTLGKNGLPMPGAKGGESELEKLRRQMLGKKAAAQGAKARNVVDRTGLPGVGAAGNNGGAPATNGQSATSFQGQKRKGREEVGDSDEDEGGRASAFKSKKTMRVKPTTSVPAVTETEHLITTTIGGMQEGEGSVPGSAKQEKHKKDEGQDQKQDGTENNEDAVVEDDGDVEESKVSKVKKPTSYLDEILLQRDKKKKKKKNKNKQNGITPESNNATK
jgi:hypothetical protein